MPTNNFPDSPEKRELRRRDRRRIEEFCANNGLPAGAAYCGVPSIEFLDIIAWADRLSSIYSVEYDPTVLADMQVQWDVLDLPLDIEFHQGDLIDVLNNTDRCFDLYNCDFYGGFIYRAEGPRAKRARCPEALRALVERHRRNERSFLMITTFNVKDTGAVEYSQFFDQAASALGGSEEATACCAAHRHNRARQLKLCFPYFCWLIGSAANFSVTLKDVFVYTSSATMMHFVIEFRFQDTGLPDVNVVERLREFAELPLRRMRGLVPSTEFVPPRARA